MRMPAPLLSSLRGGEDTPRESFCLRRAEHQDGELEMTILNSPDTLPA